MRTWATGEKIVLFFCLNRNYERMIIFIIVSLISIQIKREQFFLSMSPSLSLLTYRALSLSLSILTRGWNEPTERNPYASKKLLFLSCVSNRHWFCEKRDYANSSPRQRLIGNCRSFNYFFFPFSLFLFLFRFASSPIPVPLSSLVPDYSGTWV